MALQVIDTCYTLEWRRHLPSETSRSKPLQSTDIWSPFLCAFIIFHSAPIKIHIYKPTSRPIIMFTSQILTSLLTQKDLTKKAISKVTLMTFWWLWRNHRELEERQKHNGAMVCRFGFQLSIIKHRVFLSWPSMQRINRLLWSRWNKYLTTQLIMMILIELLTIGWVPSNMINV